jgi:hypothetical protein
MKLEFSWKIFKKNPQISNSVKIRQVGAELFHSDRQTDRLTELTVFLSFFGLFVFFWSFCLFLSFCLFFVFLLSFYLFIFYSICIYLFILVIFVGGSFCLPMWGMLKKFCNTFYTSVKINSTFFLTPHHLLQHHRTIHFLNHAWGFVEMPWYGNVQFKQ